MREQKKTRGVFEKVPGSGVWWIRYVDTGGRYRRERVGAYGLAVKLLAKRRGETVTQKKLPEILRRRSVPFTELADHAIAYIRGRYARPADDVARMELLKTKLTSAADTITAGEIQSMLDSLTIERHWSASTRNHHHNLLSLAYRLGILHGKVETSPMRGLRRKTENNSRVRFLTAEEETKLRAAIRSKPEWSPHEAELDLGLHTGLRRGSMYRNLIWENVDLENRVAMVPHTKNGERVVVPLNDIALRALLIFRSRGDGTGRVVRNVLGEPLSYNEHWFIPVVRVAGIKDFRWHDLRHTFASRLRQTGTPLGNIAELLGHKTLTMTKRYAHLSISNLHEAVARISSNSTAVAPVHQNGAVEKVDYVQ